MRNVTEISYGACIQRDEKTGLLSVSAPSPEQAKDMSEWLDEYEDKNVKVTIIIEVPDEDV